MPTAAHTKEMLDDALAIYGKVGKELGIIVAVFWNKASKFKNRSK